MPRHYPYIDDPTHPEYIEPSGHLENVWFDVDNTDLEGPASGHWTVYVEPKDELGMITKNEISELELDNFTILEVKEDGQTHIPVEEFEKVLEAMPEKWIERMEKYLQQAFLTQVEQLEKDSDGHLLSTQQSRTLSFNEGDVEEIVFQFKEHMNKDPKNQPDLESFVQDWATTLNVKAKDLQRSVYNKLKGWNAMSSQEEIKHLKKIADGLKGKKAQNTLSDALGSVKLILTEFSEGRLAEARGFIEEVLDDKGMLDQTIGKEYYAADAYLDKADKAFENFAKMLAVLEKSE
jgi:gas vesicle protein